MKAKHKKLTETGAVAQKSAHPLQLSKSRFCSGVQCSKKLYLEIHRPDLKLPIGESQQRLFDQGTEVGMEARKYYKDGLLIDADHRHPEDALAATAEALKEGHPVIFEAAFLYHSTLVRVDILQRNDDGSWDIIEVKSTTKLEDKHLPDLAIQRYVVEGWGLEVRRVLLKVLNRECRYPDLSNLFKDIDCTEKVNRFLPKVPEYVDSLLADLKKDEVPATEISPDCDKPYACQFKALCWQHIPEHSVFELHGAWPNTKFGLYRQDIVLIKDIPDGQKVSRAKAVQIESVKAGEAIIDKKGLKKFLGEFKYPLYFFDFESINPAIPRYDGMAPFDQLPFQYSCHIIDKKGAEPRHVEFLADGAGDCRREIAESVLKTLGTRGTIIAYYQSFEKNRIEDLADHLPSLANELRGLLPRFIDLMDAFTKHYYHPNFHGSFSIKEVLPALIPEMSYDGMPVHDGSSAQVAFEKLCSSEVPKEEKNQIRGELLSYCKQDTLAMVELWSVLKTIFFGK